MTLRLDHIQRLNLHALLGAQRGDVATVRALWAIQDKLTLTPDEEKTIEFRREFVGGQEHLLWNPALALPAREFEFTETEMARIKAALKTWDHYGVSIDREWLAPLLDAMVSPERLEAQRLAGQQLRHRQQSLTQ